jgi:hypothetical protein
MEEAMNEPEQDLNDPADEAEIEHARHDYHNDSLAQKADDAWHERSDK